MSWLLRSQKLPTSDVSEPLISVTDLKHYFYCPRIVYFEKVLHAEPELGSQQEESKSMHEDLDEKEKRRRGALYYSKELLEAEKLFRVPLASRILGIQGTIDCLVKTGEEYIPIEYKNMASRKGKPWADHKYQLVAYALLVEENYATIVKRGYINYLPEKLAVLVQITSSLKSYTIRIVNSIRRMIEEEELPKIRVPPMRCTGGCGYKWVCQPGSIAR